MKYMFFEVFQACKKWNSCFLRFFQVAPLKNDTKKHWIICQTFRPICQNFPTHLPKVLPLLTTQLSHPPKKNKKKQQGNLPCERNWVSFQPTVEFFDNFFGATESNGNVPKSPDGKTSKVWLNARRLEDHQYIFLHQLWWGWRSQNNNKKNRPQAWNGKLSFLSGVNKRNEPSEIIWNIFFVKIEEVAFNFKQIAPFCFLASGEKIIFFFCLLLKKKIREKKNHVSWKSLRKKRVEPFQINKTFCLTLTNEGKKKKLRFLLPLHGVHICGKSTERKKKKMRRRGKNNRCNPPSPYSKHRHTHQYPQTRTLF